jgi:hypothetical protein
MYRRGTCGLRGRVLPALGLPTLNCDCSADVSGLGQFDLVFSLIALQHNPPPLIAYFVRHLLGALLPGGIAYMQVPVYREGYTFDPAEHLQDVVPAQSFGMHVLPQRELFAVVREAGCELLEVIEDDHAGAALRSNVFVATKSDAGP